MLSLEVEHNELIKRLLNRGKDSGRADDRNSEVIEKRIKVYNSETTPVIEYYDYQNKYKSIAGMGTIDEIFNNLCVAIES